MNLNEAQRLVLTGESHVLELKKSTGQLRRACETACAFLNTDGGFIVIGATEDLRIIGQEVSEKTKREIGCELAKITPASNIEVFYIPVDANKCLIVFHITTDSTKKPYLYDDRAYIRMQTETRPMPREYLQQLIISNADANHQWENHTYEKMTIADLEHNEILTTLKEGVINGRIPENYHTNDPWIALQRLGLIIDNKVTNAAIVLFAKHPERSFPQCLLRVARFRGTNKSEFIDQKQIRGNVFKLIKEAMSFALAHLPVSSTFPEGALQRKDTPLFPILALREAIANAICHRDYTISGGSISFAIYDDRIEIWNYGLLPLGVSVENLKDLNESLPRNPRIANVLYYHRLFESWGRGVQMIISECTKAGHPEPFYSQEAGGTKLTLPSHHLIGSTSPIISEPLTMRQKEIMALLKTHNGLSPDELRHLMAAPIAERTLRDELNRLKEQGLIDALGQTRTRKWYVKP